MAHPHRDALLGGWQVVAAYVVLQDTGERSDLYGKAPRGQAVFSPSGRMVSLMLSSDREHSETDAGKAALFRSMMTYAGAYDVDGETFTTHVDIAWEPSWEGTRQVRYYTLADGKLSVRSAPMDHPLFPGRKTVAHVEWVRLGDGAG